MKLIGFGGENIVLKANDNYVIKRPFGLRYFIDPRETVSEIISDLKVLKVYFKNFIAETEITPSKGSAPLFYTMKQSYVKGKALTKELLKSEEVHRQFKEIMAINSEMVRSENKSYEFLGIWSLIFSHILKRVSNILVEDGTKKLYIIDIGVLYLGGKYHSRLLSLIYKWAYRRQVKLLERFLTKEYPLKKDTH